MHYFSNIRNNSMRRILSGYSTFKKWEISIKGSHWMNYMRSICLCIQSAHMYVFVLIFDSLFVSVYKCKYVRFLRVFVCWRLLISLLGGKIQRTDKQSIMLGWGVSDWSFSLENVCWHEGHVGHVEVIWILVKNYQYKRRVWLCGK